MSGSISRLSVVPWVEPMFAACAPVLTCSGGVCGVVISIGAGSDNVLGGVGLCAVAHATFLAVASGVDVDDIAVVSDKCNGV